MFKVVSILVCLISQPDPCTDKSALRTAAVPVDLSSLQFMNGFNCQRVGNAYVSRPWVLGLTAEQRAIVVCAK